MIEDTQQMTGDFFPQNYAEILYVPNKGFFENILYHQDQGKQILITKIEIFLLSLHTWCQNNFTCELGCAF